LTGSGPADPVPSRHVHANRFNSISDEKTLQLIVTEPYDKIMRDLVNSGWAEVSNYGNRCIINATTIAYVVGQPAYKS
jgi:hypothetical protein